MTKPVDLTIQKIEQQADPAQLNDELQKIGARVVPIRDFGTNSFESFGSDECHIVQVEPEAIDEDNMRRVRTLVTDNGFYPVPERR